MKKTYTCLTTIDHDQQRFAVGDPIELDDKKQAPPLLAVGAIEPPPAAKAEKKAE